MTKYNDRNKFAEEIREERKERELTITVNKFEIENFIKEKYNKSIYEIIQEELKDEDNYDYARILTDYYDPKFLDKILIFEKVNKVVELSECIDTFVDDSGAIIDTYIFYSDITQEELDRKLESYITRDNIDIDFEAIIEDCLY